jgi:hypothetical protein
MDAEGVFQGKLDSGGDGPHDIGGRVSNAASEARQGIINFVESAKSKIPADPVRKLSETASQVTQQVRGYIDDRGIRGLTDDVTDVVRRYPVPALLCGVLIGMLLARPGKD